MTQQTVALVGNPNCGKSTLFNALTGSRQKVANWPGVTVECMLGELQIEGQALTLVDLPGIYQLSCGSDQQAIDERITSDYILEKKCDVIVNVIDGSSLERHLYLTLQLLSMNIPVVVAINMLDVAKRRGMTIDLVSLQQALGCPVVGLVASKCVGLDNLHQAIGNSRQLNQTAKNQLDYPEPLDAALKHLIPKIYQSLPSYSWNADWLALQLLQKPDEISISLPVEVQTIAKELKTRVQVELNEDMDIIVADLLYSKAHNIAINVSNNAQTKAHLSEKIDKVVLNRFLGIPIFLLVMYCMFLFAINLGGAFQDFFDLGSDAIFVQGTTAILETLHAPNWLIALLAAGLGKGLNTTISFIPVIGGMFFFLAFLESSGYMARATFVIDRLMRTVGLPGKSFVPMIVGFGCNVPAILAARTLENPRDRTLTILMSPFMSCGARLAIFAVFTAAFFPVGGQNIVFTLYFIGIAIAIFTGWILRSTLCKGDLSPLILELPAYHLPSLKSLCFQTWHRLKSFVFRAGKIIVPVCMLIGLLNTINLDGSLSQEASNQSSVLSAIGKGVTPVLSPMGITENNWPATVGLVTGVMAKEVVVATLNTLYLQDAHLVTTHIAEQQITTNLKAALMSVPNNLVALKNSITNPVIASTPENTVNHSIYGIMYERFGSKAAAFAYLLFVLLYIPCISATAVMAKELNKRWALFSVLWSTGIAYAVATSFYQLATFQKHPQYSFIWLTVIAISMGTILSLFKKYGQYQEERAQSNHANCNHRHHLGCS
jgi:ferrous iron transport protein B